MNERFMVVRFLTKFPKEDIQARITQIVKLALDLSQEEFHCLRHKVLVTAEQIFLGLLVQGTGFAASINRFLLRE